jgi:uncharacterized Fe-S center protein
MKTNERHSKQSKTMFIQLDKRKCEACWKCIESCKKNVLGKIDIWFHKHSKIRNAENCVGCGSCARVCEYGAIIDLT